MNFFQFQKFGKMAKRYNIIEDDRSSKKRRIEYFSSDLQLLDLPVEILESIINGKCDYLERFVMGNVCKTFHRCFDKSVVPDVYGKKVKGRGFLKCHPSSERWRYDAAKCGYVNVFNWLFEFPRGWDNWHSSVSASMRGASKGGRVEILRGLPYHEYTDVNVLTCTRLATKKGNLNVLEWFENEEFEGLATGSDRFVNVKVGMGNILSRASVWNEALKRGDLNFLNWLKERREHFADICFGVPARKGHLHVMEWMKKQGFSLKGSFPTVVAARENQFEALKWLLDNGAVLSPDTFSAASAAGNLETMRWLKTKNCPMNKDCTEMAARYGQFEALKWLNDNGCEFSGETCYGCVRADRTDMLDWALKNGATWGRESNCLKKATGRSLEMLKFVIKNGCDWVMGAEIELAKKGNVEGLIWINERQYKWSYMAACHWALNACQFKVVDWLLDSGFPVTQLVLEASANHHTFKKRYWDEYKNAYKKLVEKATRIATTTTTTE
jgi:hypothetical protein